MACLLQSVRERDAPSSLKNDVFSLSLSTFGSEGPRTCHPFAHELDIVDAVFVDFIGVQSTDTGPHLQQASFSVTDRLNPEVSTAATLRDLKQLPSNLQAGDVLRLEVVSSSPQHAVLQVPPFVDFMVPSTREKPVVILNVMALGCRLCLHFNQLCFMNIPFELRF